MDYRYFGEYATFVPADKPSGELLQGADFVIGEELEIEFRGEEAWLKNRFGADAGKLDATVARRLRVCAAREWTCKAVLSAVAFSSEPDPGFYWGQAALVCFDPLYAEAFDAWLEAVRAKVADGARVQVALTEPEVDKVLESRGTWLPAGRAEVPFPEEGKSVILKDHRTFSENMIELGRQRKLGCLVVGWVFNIALIAGVAALVLHLVGVF